MTKHLGRVSTQTQRLVLLALGDYEEWTGASTTKAAGLLGKPRFTAMRAFDELAAIDPGLIGVEGKARWLTPGERKPFLQKVSPYLFNPVAREYRLGRVPALGHLPLSGLSAIERHSGAEPDALAPCPAFAVTKAQERELGLREGRGLAGWSDWGSPACAVHVMSYELDSMKDAAIDPVSAILALSDDEMGDPLVEEAVVRILKKSVDGK